jgi:uncharacterized integral membrane protein (TIGR00698 family)
LLSNEDWLAVWTGLLLIAFVLTGLRLQLPVFAWSGGGELLAKVLHPANLWRALEAGVALGILSALGVYLMAGSPRRFAAGFPLVYLLSLVSLVVAGNVSVGGWGLEYVIFAFALGLVVSNVIGVPSWLAEAARTEYYIKTGLVVLGTSIVFGDLLRAGVLGVAQALCVVTAVWFFCFWLARRLNVDDEFATMLASAVSICGVSAAIATCGAIQGDRKKLSYVTSLVLIVAAPMMVIMPIVIKAFHIPDLVGGAWLGGTLDTSASVVAAGEMISRSARDAGVVVKLSQNVLIGVAAFLLTIWWTFRDRERTGETPSLAIIWERFPKFVLGFIATSLLFSFALSAGTVKDTSGLLNGIRTLWFALAFTSIGLETRFSELMRAESGRAAVAFLGGQAFNVIWTLILAYLLFGGFIVPAPHFG